MARSALSARRYAGHPYAISLPDPALVASIGDGDLRRLHGERVLPAGSTLVLVGELDPAAATDAVAEALAGWTGDGTAEETVPATSLHAPVFGPDGQVALSLTLNGFDGQDSPQRLRQCLDRLLVAAGNITRRLGGSPPS